MRCGTSHASSDRMPVSLLITVLNEGASIRALLDSIAAQTQPPDEIVVVDGGSTDETLAILAAYADRLPLRIIERPGVNISEGRNLAAQHAAHPILAITDAGVVLDPDWRARITAPLADESVAVVAGFFQPDVVTPFEVAMGATVLPTPADIDPASFLPSSRSVAMRRSAFEEAGGYPEWLDYCEDLILDMRLKTLAGPFAFAPEAVVHFKPRTTLGDFLKQYYRYARGDGKADLFRRRHLIRYLTYLAALPLLIAGAIVVSRWLLLFLLAGGLYMVGRPYQRLTGLWGHLDAVGRVQAALWVPVIRVAGDLAKMAGYPVGRIWRMRHQPPDWRIRPEPVYSPRIMALLKRDAAFSSRFVLGKGPLRALAILLTRTGDGLAVTGAYAAAFLLSGAVGRRTVLLVLLADVVTFLIIQTLKVRVRRPRPLGVWGADYRRGDPHSFPSGHAARGGTIAGMALLLGPPWFRAAGIAWGILLAISRVAVGVHFVLDVTVGFFIGLSVAGVIGLVLALVG
ncbi:MAG: glycosyltransferase [Anaerolineae bacterium]